MQSVVECEASCNATAACVALETEARSPMASSSASITAAAAAASLLQPKIEGPAGMLVGSLNCTLLRVAGPGAPDSSRTTYVRAPGVPIKYDWTGTYNAAPPVCPEQPNWVCKRYVNSWFPNATAGGGQDILVQRVRRLPRSCSYEPLPRQSPVFSKCDCWL